ncbi:MAG: ImmA/IrrE family metallo-endopeptidase [Candidatus Binataceae bacterium]
MNGKVASLSEYREIVRRRARRRGRILNPERERFIRERARSLLWAAWQEESKRRKIEVNNLLPIEPKWVFGSSNLFPNWSFEEPIEIGASATSGREIAGALDRVARKLEVASNLAAHIRRFTGAHELGHLILHPALVSLREAPLTEFNIRDQETILTEREANVFAAELIMPTRLVRESFERRFGQIIDRASISPDEAFYFTNDKFSVSDLRKKDPVALAMIIAQASSFTTSDSRALTDVFGVSPIAMAIQLVDLALII